MSADPKTEKVLSLLEALTRSGRLRWEATADEEIYRAAFPSSVVRLSPDGFTILDEGGREVDEFTAVAEQEIARVQDLHSRARRSALNADQVLDNLIRDLQSQLPPLGAGITGLRPNS